MTFWNYRDGTSLKWLDYWFGLTAFQFERLRLSKFHVVDKISINLIWCNNFKFFSNYVEKGTYFPRGTTSVKRLNYFVPHTASRFHFIDKISVKFMCLHKPSLRFYKPLKNYVGRTWFILGKQVYERVKLLNLPSMRFNFKNLKQLGSISLIRFQRILYD